ncbi:TadE/TadG family type IV pilus assembly protein [Planctomicrobium sp. SH664]|uniref:TadE/TadG family type IV pilus assembly protein n=1 Tax=Planctomicrobium sp. SH664 TaxID=3448125 RepID=UPI003F5C9869
MELVLALPILLLLIAALFEFSFLFAARGDVVQAARAGARLAALNGVQEEDIELEVEQTLGGRFGTSYSVESQLGTAPGDEVVVAVRVPMTAAAPNLLWAIGYNLQGREIISESRVLKE